MRISARELSFLPLVCFFVVAVDITATIAGSYLSPMSIRDGNVAAWLITYGVPTWLVTGHITFFLMEAPSLLVLACFSAGLFFLRTRLADMTVAASLCLFPFVGALGIGIGYLRTQSITTITILLILAVYCLARLSYPIRDASPRKRPLQFSIRTVLIGVVVAAILSPIVITHVERRADFFDPPVHAASDKPTHNEVRKLIDELDKGGAVRAADLQLTHPPCGIKYWRQQAAKVQSGMTIHALFKYLPNASMSGSWLITNNEPFPTQVFYYAVDSQYAVLCEMTTYNTNPRVVEMVGIFPHHLRFNDGGTLNLTKLELANRRQSPAVDEPIVVFGE